MADEDYVAMLRARREFEIIRESNNVPPCAGPSWIRETLLDAQLAAGVESLLERMQGRPWPSPGASEATVVAFDDELRRASDERMRLIERLVRVDDRIRELGIVPGSVDEVCRRYPATTTSAPRSASKSAVSRPMLAMARPRPARRRPGRTGRSA